MPRTSKKITTQKIVPQALTPKVVKARPMIQFGTGSSRGCFGESVTCEKVASLILTCPDIQAAINAVSSPDIFIVSVVPTALPGVFTANLSDGTSFTIDLSSLVENQTLSLLNGILTISEGNTIDLCPVIAYCITNNGLPAGVDLFTLNGTTITTGSTHHLTLDSNANTLELEVDGVTVSTAPIVNSNTIDTVGNTITSTVNGISDTAPIINSVSNTVDANGDLITTINGVPSSPLDLGSILDIDDQQLSSAGNTMSLTNGGTAPIVNSITSSTDVNGDLIVTVNGISSAPIDINPDCADVIACVESEPNLNLQNVSTNNLTVAGDLSIPASEISLTTSVNTATLTLGNQTVNAPIVNSNVLSSAGLTLTSTVNGIADSEDLTGAVQALITSNTDSVTNTVAGHLIATHTAVDNSVVNINETVTSLGTPTIAGNILTIPFNNENGVLQTVTVDLGGITPTNDINISTATYTAATNIITLTETNGDVYTIDLSEFSITTNTLPNGDVQIIQEGVVKATIPGAITILSYIPTCSGNVVSATNQVLTKDSLTTNVTVPTTVTTTPDPLTTPYTKAVKVNVGCNEDVYVPDTLGSLPVVAPVNQLCPVNAATTFVGQDYVRNNAGVLEVYSPRHRVITNPAFNPTAPTVGDLNATVTDGCGFTWEVDCQGNVVFTGGQKQYRQMDVWNSADDTFPFNSTDTSGNGFDLYRSVFSLSVNMCVPVLPLGYRAYFSGNIVESGFSIEFANTAGVLRHITGLGFDSWYIDRTIDMTSSGMDIRNNIERIPLVISGGLVNGTNNFQVSMEYRVDNGIAPFNTGGSMYGYVYGFDGILSIVRS